MKKLLLLFLFISIFSFGQNKSNLDYLYPKKDLIIEYQDEWGKNNFKKKIEEFKKIPLDFGDIIFDRSALAQLPSEYVEQMVAESLSWIGGQAYKPRNSALLRAISAKTTFSLHGCVLIPQPGNVLRISREHVAVAKVKSLCPALWDGRYFAPNHNKTYEIRALGAYGLSLCPDWRFDKIPRIALESSPSVWQNDQLISAPQAGFGQKDVLQVVPTPWE